ncbi:MAG: hypothetical protein V4539_05625 [Bacteroidota bacterium]
MKKITLAVTIAVIYLIAYLTAVCASADIKILFGMFILSPFVLIFMVYTVLKHGTPSKYTFDERRYDDWGQRGSESKEIGTPK